MATISMTMFNSFLYVYQRVYIYIYHLEYSSNTNAGKNWIDSCDWMIGNPYDGYKENVVLLHIICPCQDGEHILKPMFF